MVWVGVVGVGGVTVWRMNIRRLSGWVGHIEERVSVVILTAHRF